MVLSDVSDRQCLLAARDQVKSLKSLQATLSFEMMTPISNIVFFLEQFHK